MWERLYNRFSLLKNDKHWIIEYAILIYNDSGPVGNDGATDLGADHPETLSYED